MKMSNLVLSLITLTLLLSLSTAGTAEAGNLATWVANTYQLAMTELSPASCGSTQSPDTELFAAPAFVNPPTGCYSCQGHWDCRSYCGDYGSCFRDTTFSCSLSPYDKFCFC